MTWWNDPIPYWQRPPDPPPPPPPPPPVIVIKKRLAIVSRDAEFIVAMKAALPQRSDLEVRTAASWGDMEYGAAVFTQHVIVLDLRREKTRHVPKIINKIRGTDAKTKIVAISAKPVPGGIGADKIFHVGAIEPITEHALSLLFG